MKARRFIAAVMAICMVTGAVSYNVPEFTQSVSANAVDGSCYSFDEESGVLTLRENVDRDVIMNLEYKDAVTSVIAEEGTVLPEDCLRLFFDFYYCVTIDLSNADTRNVIRMAMMFSGCERLEELDLSNFDTSNVTDMRNMFGGCSKLKELRLGENFGNITENHSLSNKPGWVNANSPKTVVSGNGEYAVIENTGANVYLKTSGETAEENLLAGDVNGDGAVNVADIVLLEQYLLGAPDTNINWNNADLDGDGKVNVFDLIRQREFYISVHDVILGDFNNDGQVDQSDVDAIMKHYQLALSGLDEPLDERTMKAGDLDKDSYITVTDAYIIKYYLEYCSENGNITLEEYLSKL